MEDLKWKKGSGTRGGTRHSKRTGRLRRAFTITELVIVIAVIATLAAVLIPTFANVIENSKKSHDEQYVKEMNVTLNAYTIRNNGQAPEDYEELMLALAEDGLCDASNPFLLATKLKQDDVYLVWYPRANSVSLIDLEDGQYNITFSAEIGLGNGVLVHDSLGNTSTLGYALCSTGTEDGAYIAGIYRDFYIEAGGDLSEFNSKFGESYSATNIQGNVANVAWGSSIVAALQNQKLSYTFSSAIANELTSQTATGSNISVTVPSTSGDNAVSSTVQQQVVRATLATLVTLSNDTASAADFAGKKVTFGQGGESLKDVSVDLSEVTMSAINPIHRDSVKKDAAATPASYSVDFGGMTLDGYTLDEAFVPAGASWQDASDNDFTGGAYNYAYGLFGTLYNKPGAEPVVIENLHFSNINIELDGDTYTVDGDPASIVADSAGIVCGTALGSVTFRNITIDGTQASGAKGYIHGYDAIGGIVGRCYSEPSDTTDAKASMVTIDNCHISNMQICGVRKVGGFTGIWGNDNFLTVTNSSLTNVDVIGDRNIIGDSEEDRKSTIAGLLAGHTNCGGNVATQNGIGSSFSNVVITDCTVVNRYEVLGRGGEYVYFYGGPSIDMAGSGWDTTGSYNTGVAQAEVSLTLFGDISTHCLALTDFVVQTTANGGWSYTYDWELNNGTEAVVSAWHSNTQFTYLGGKGETTDASLVTLEVGTREKNAAVVSADEKFSINWNA